MFVVISERDKLTHRFLLDKDVCTCSRVVEMSTIGSGRKHKRKGRGRCSFSKKAEQPQHKDRRFVISASPSSVPDKVDSTQVPETILEPLPA